MVGGIGMKALTFGHASGQISLGSAGVQNPISSLCALQRRKGVLARKTGETGFGVEIW